MPAAILMLIGAVATGISNSMPGDHVRASALPGIITGLGLLLGGPGFRRLGVVVNGLGLIVWPFLLATGAMGPATAGDWCGLLGNLGVLILLIGEPSRLRVWAGVTVSALAFATGIGIGAVEEIWAEHVRTSAGVNSTPPVSASQSPAPAQPEKAPDVQEPPRIDAEMDVAAAMREWHARVRADDLSGELAYWRPTVEYFTHGYVTRAHVEADRNRFYSAPYHQVTWENSTIIRRGATVHVAQDVEFSTGPERPGGPPSTTAELARARAANGGRLPRPYSARARVTMVWVRGETGWQIGGIREEKVYWRRRSVATATPPSFAVPGPQPYVPAQPETPLEEVKPAPLTTPSPNPVPNPPRRPLTRIGGGFAGEVYADTGGKHWIDEVSNSGRIVELEDGSVWEISELDVIDTALWLTTDDVIVVESRDPLFPYLLINKDEHGEKAHAKLLRH